MVNTKERNINEDYFALFDVSFFEMVWPLGLSPADQALWDQLPIERQVLVMQRLKAIVAAEEGILPIGDLAGDAGLDRTQFFRLRQRWRNEPTLRTIIPQARRKARKIAPRYPRPNEAGGDAEDLISWAIEQHTFDASTSQIAKTVVEASPGSMSPQTAMRLVRQQRAKNRLDPIKLQKHFGEKICLDLSAMSLALMDTDDAGGAVILAVVLEPASGLVVGHAAGGVHESVFLQRRAILRALDVLDVDRPHANYSKATVVLGWAEESELRVREWWAQATPGVARVLPLKTSRFGRLMFDILGHRIDRIRLRPKSTHPDSPGHRDTDNLSFPPMSAANARALVDEAVANYNAPIIKVLADAGLFRPTGPAGSRIAVTLEELVNVFNKV